MRALLILLFFANTLLAEDLKETQKYAEALFKRRFYKDAIIEFSKSSKSLNPKVRNHSYLRLSNCYEQLKEHQKALDFFLLYRPEASTNKTQVELKKAILYQNAHKDKEAIQILEELSTLRNSKFWLSSQFYLAQSLIRLKETQRASLILEKLSKAPFEDPHKIKLFSLLTLAELNYKNQDFGKAKQTLVSLKNSKNLNKSLKKQCLALLGNTLAQLREYDSALKVFEEALKDFPELQNFSSFSYHYSKSLIETKNVEKARSVLSKNDDRNSYLTAYSFIKEEKWTKAIDFFKDFLVKFPDSKLKEKAQFFICYSLSQSQQHQLVINHTNEFIEQFPASTLLADIYLYRAIAQRKTDTPKAINSFQKAILLGEKQEKWQNLPKAQIQFAKLYQSLKNYDDSSTIWKNLLNNPKYTALSIQNLLLTINKTKDPHLSLQNFLKALQNNKIQIEGTQLELLATLIQQHSKDNSEAELEKLLTYQNNKNKILKLIAHNQFRLLKYEKALGSFSKVEKSLESFDQIIMAYCYKKLKKDTKAISCWDQAFSKNTSNKIPNENLSFIARELLLNQKFDSSSNIYQGLRKSKQTQFQAEAINGLAFITLQKKKFEDSISLAQEGLKITQNELIKGELLCTLAEAYFKQKKSNLATLNIEKTNKLRKLSNFTKARLNFVLAELHFQGKDYEQAHSYASRSYILFKNPIYTPQSMLLDIKALEKLNRTNDSKTIINELKANYPHIYKKL